MKRAAQITRANMPAGEVARSAAKGGSIGRESDEIDKSCAK